MRTPRKWYRDELNNKNGMNIALAILVAMNGWVGDDPTARSICLVAALAMLRGKL